MKVFTKIPDLQNTVLDGSLPIPGVDFTEVMWPLVCWKKNSNAWARRVPALRVMGMFLNLLTLRKITDRS